jgi:hypothetical protein
VRGNSCRNLPAPSGRGCSRAHEPSLRSGRPRRSGDGRHAVGGGSAGRWSAVCCCSSEPPRLPPVSPAGVTRMTRAQPSPRSDPCDRSGRRRRRARRRRLSKGATQRALRDGAVVHRSRTAARPCEQLRTRGRRRRGRRRSRLGTGVRQ